MDSRVAHFVSASAVVLAVLLCPTRGWAEQIIGRASVVDGDTIEIHGTRIRLWGIDAPESDQLCRGDDSEQYRCGQKAAAALATLFFAIPRPVICTPVDLDQYGRPWQSVRWEARARTSGSGSCRTVMPLIRPGTQRESATKPNAGPRMQGGASGQEASPRRGFIGTA